MMKKWLVKKEQILMRNRGHLSKFKMCIDVKPHIRDHLNNKRQENSIQKM